MLAGINLYDAWYAWQWNDPAMYGHLTIFAGGVATILSSVLGGAATFFGLSPYGWAALLLLGTGIGLVLLMSSTPLETWLANGPFGESDDIDQHLQDPTEALYRLISLLADIRISVNKNPAYEPQAKFNFRADTPQPIRSADTLIRIESRLPGLISGLGSLSINTECRLNRTYGNTDKQGMHYQTASKIGSHAELPKGQRVTADSIELFFTTPKKTNVTIGSMQTFSVQWTVRAQFVLMHGKEALYFPAPSIRDSTRYSTERAKPDFSKISQNFWADEVTHGNSANE